MSGSVPLTLGTAGHVDHGKTVLVRALTGTDTDRLPEERARGISIALGYALLRLPSGRRLSVVDVPGHERFVRTMVAGATGIDLFLMVVAADDGVMPQTREHAAVLRGLGVATGVVAIAKCDLADPERARGEVAELLPGVPAVAVSGRTGAGLDELRAALEEAAVAVGEPRAAAGAGRDAGAPRLHVDRVFTVRGAGTVVTGTLWEGTIGRGDELALLPGERPVRVRGVQVHDEPAERAAAGQRVAVNLTGVGRDAVARGDVLTARASGLGPSYALDAALDVALPRGRVHVHHGTRDAPARVVPLGGDLHQLRLEQPLVAARGDRLVIRAVAPADTLGGGVVLDPQARRHGPAPEALARLEALRRGETVGPGGAARPAAGPPPAAPPAPLPPLSPAAGELEARLRAAGHEPPLDRELDAAALAELRAHGRAVRCGPALHFHPDALAEVERRLRAVAARDGVVTLASLRDELGTSRKFAQALLEHFDRARVTARQLDDTRTLRGRAGPAS